MSNIISFALIVVTLLLFTAVLWIQQNQINNLVEITNILHQRIQEMRKNEYTRY